MKNSSPVPVVYSIRQVVSTRLPTRWGLFQTFGFEREAVNGIRRIETALAFAMGNLSDAPPLLRIHSQCFTGEILGPLRCDCGDQFEIAMQAIAKEGRGLVIYEYQEGRGIGLMAKLRAYALLDTGLDTVEPNHTLGLGTDYRDFSLSAAILHHLGISRVRLLSHNPNKIRALLTAGISVEAQVPCEATPNSHSLPYLSTNKEKTGHTLSLGSAGPDSDRNTQWEPASTETNHVGSEDEFEGHFPASRRVSIADFAEEVQ
jgi:GTP cyclohydrolase II